MEHVSSLDGMEVIITATVGDRFLDEVIEGYSSARISNSTVSAFVSVGFQFLIQFFAGETEIFGRFSASFQAWHASDHVFSGILP